MNTGGLSCSLGTDPGAVRGHGCSPDSWNQTQPWEACCLPASLSEGGDSCFVSQEKLKTWLLEGSSWEDEALLSFSGEEVLVCREQGKGDGFWGGRAVIFPWVQSLVRIHALSSCS